MSKFAEYLEATKENKTKQEKSLELLKSWLEKLGDSVDKTRSFNNSIFLRFKKNKDCQEIEITETGYIKESIAIKKWQIKTFEDFSKFYNEPYTYSNENKKNILNEKRLNFLKKYKLEKQILDNFNKSKSLGANTYHSDLFEITISRDKIGNFLYIDRINIKRENLIDLNLNEIEKHIEFLNDIKKIIN